MDPAVAAYVEAIGPESRPLYDRVHALVLEVHPGAEVVLSYKIPTFVVGRKRLYVGAWKHGVSLYGGTVADDSEFLDRHPGLRTGKGTIKLSREAAAQVADDELRALFRKALDPEA